MGVVCGNSEPTIEIKDLKFTYPGIDGHPPPGSAPLIQDFSLSLSSGDRCLLVGSNGAGKTTILKILGGKHMVEPGMVRVLGRSAFHDTNLTSSGDLCYLGGEWRRDVAFAGYEVAIQMDVSAEKMIFGVAGIDPERRAELIKLASSLGPRFYSNIFKCKQISETGAQQMLLDTQAVKTILLEIPSLGRQTSGAAGYSKFVSREMSKAEALLKVILSPVDSVADTYRALLPEGTPMEFQRILDLKGLKKADQQSILDDFNKHGPGIKQTQITPTVVPASPVAPVVPNPSAAGLMASREDVLTRAAALGRGAATTGFKRFLALTEAAKDRKDGPFRKLFNP